MHTTTSSQTFKGFFVDHTGIKSKPSERETLQNSVSAWGSCYLEPSSPPRYCTSNFRTKKALSTPQARREEQGLESRWQPHLTGRRMMEWDS